MKTFKHFTNIYCVLLYVLGFIYSIDEFIAFHIRHEFFEGYRVAVPIMIFIFFHFPALLFFIIVKDLIKWTTLLIAMIILLILILVGFYLSTIIAPLVITTALILHVKTLIQTVKVKKKALQFEN